MALHMLVSVADQHVPGPGTYEPSSHVGKHQPQSINESPSSFSFGLSKSDGFKEKQGTPLPLFSSRPIVRPSLNMCVCESARVHACLQCDTWLRTSSLPVAAALQALATTMHIPHRLVCRNLPLSICLRGALRSFAVVVLQGSKCWAHAQMHQVSCSN